MKPNLPDATERPSAAPMKHYAAIYRTQDPQEIAARTGLAFDADASVFHLKLLGTPLTASYPEFDIVPEANPYEKLLIIRYLTEGAYVLPSGKLLSYEELPWGSVYMQNFRGRVIGRLAREFGRGTKPFPDIIESMAGLNYDKISIGDYGYRIEFIDNLYVSVIYYEGDDEFPASFQVLFDDNIKYAFTAEDVAVIGDVLIGRLRKQL